MVENSNAGTGSSEACTRRASSRFLHIVLYNYALYYFVINKC